MENELKRLFIPNTHGVTFVNPIEICFCIAKNKGSEIYLTDGKGRFLNLPLVRVESLLPRNLFFKCHRGFIVNILYIESYTRIKNDRLSLKNGHIIRISRRKKKELFELFKLQRSN